MSTSARPPRHPTGLDPSDPGPSVGLRVGPRARAVWSEEIKDTAREKETAQIQSIVRSPTCQLQQVQSKSQTLGEGAVLPCCRCAAT